MHASPAIPLPAVPMARRLTASVIAALVATTAAAGAEGARHPWFTFEGYGTLGLVHSSEGEADFLGSLLLAHGAGHSRSWSPEVDSRIGAQLTANLSPRLSAVVQVLVEQRFDGNYTPHLEWANLQYQLTPDASVRLGRIVLPSFMVSGYRKVGYANAWVRPPVEVYALVPITTNDGIDASYRFAIGDATQSVQALFGQSDTALVEGGTAEARNAWGIAATTERGPATVRFAYQQTALTIDSFNTLFDTFRRFGPAGDAIAERFDADGSALHFAAVGALYDPGRWFATAEWGTLDTDSAVGDRTAWYISGGFRLGTLTPYATYSTVTPDNRRSDPGLPTASYPPELEVGRLNDALNDLLARKPEQSTLSLGVRWDFRKNLDLKLQLGHCRLGTGSAGNLGNLQPGFRPGGSYDLISLALDIVF
jgi:hypothetical protein